MGQKVYNGSGDVAGGGAEVFSYHQMGSGSPRYEMVVAGREG
jgi:hypothetical protein